MGIESSGRKVFQVEGHNEPDASFDGRCQHMPVLFMVQALLNESFIACYERFWKAGLHLLTQ